MVTIIFPDRFLGILPKGRRIFGPISRNGNSSRKCANVTPGERLANFAQVGDHRHATPPVPEARLFAPEPRPVPTFPCQISYDSRCDAWTIQLCQRECWPTGLPVFRHTRLMKVALALPVVMVAMAVERTGWIRAQP